MIHKPATRHDYFVKPSLIKWKLEILSFMALSELRFPGSCEILMNLGDRLCNSSKLLIEMKLGWHGVHGMATSLFVLFSVCIGTVQTNMTGRMQNANLTLTFHAAFEQTKILVSITGAPWSLLYS